MFLKIQPFNVFWEGVINIDILIASIFLFEKGNLIIRLNNGLVTLVVMVE